MSVTTRDKLETWTLEFTDAFNRNDLDGVMNWFADDAIYDEFHGGRHEGKAAIRDAFEPQFAGRFGTMRFNQEDLFLDPETGKAMISWLCTLDSGDRYGGWRGLDLLHFDADGRLLQKHTYAKTDKPQMRRLDR